MQSLGTAENKVRIYGAGGVSDGFIFLAEAEDVIFDHTEFINESYYGEVSDQFNYLNTFDNYKDIEGFTFASGTNCHSTVSHNDEIILEWEVIVVTLVMILTTTAQSIL